MLLHGVLCVAHDDFWSAIDNRIAAAESFLSEMFMDILPAWDSARHLEAIRWTGAVASHSWQERFYYHFDAFLAMARSAPEIIRCLFGVDPVLSSWLKSLDPTELARRKSFQSQFETAYQAFEDF